MFIIIALYVFYFISQQKQDKFEIIYYWENVLSSSNFYYIFLLNINFKILKVSRLHVFIIYREKHDFLHLIFIFGQTEMHIAIHLVGMETRFPCLTHLERPHQIIARVEPTTKFGYTPNSSHPPADQAYIVICHDYYKYNNGEIYHLLFSSTCTCLLHWTLKQGHLKNILRSKGTKVIQN